MGRINLTMKELKEKPEGFQDRKPSNGGNKFNNKNDKGGFKKKFFKK